MGYCALNNSIPTQENSGFIFPEFSQKIVPYFKSLWQTYMEYGWVDVLYEGQVVLQIWNLPEGKKIHNVVLSFYPYSYGNNLVQRFKSCCYYQDFADFDSEEDNYMQAAFDTDIKTALRVASYILSAVYGIPMSYRLEINLSQPQAKW